MDVHLATDTMEQLVLYGLVGASLHDGADLWTSDVVGSGSHGLVDLIPKLFLWFRGLDVWCNSSPHDFLVCEFYENRGPAKANTTTDVRSDKDVKMDSSLMVSVSTVLHADVYCWKSFRCPQSVGVVP